MFESTFRTTLVPTFNITLSNEIGEVVVAAPPTEFLLLETGDTLLMESGDKIGLE